MESVLERAEKMAGTQLTKFRWALGINGLFAVASGVVILVWPGISLFALTILFGAWTAANGAVGLAAALSGATTQSRAWLALTSLLSLALGIAVIVWPSISTLALLYVIGGYAIALGVFAVFGAFYLPMDGGDTALMVLTGLVSILFGVVMFAKPGAGALVTLALISAFALVTGITEIVVAIGGRRLVESNIKRSLGSPRPQPSH
jgi:uncharacterized membrane protein HdeD (DUF308 family)